MERPSGPLGTATQSSGRPLDSNGLPRLPPLNTVRKFPNTNTTVRHAASNPSLSSQIPISAAQVVVLAREAMKNALDENQTKAAEASGVSNELKPGVTIDLSHKQIQRFPEEVVDIIKNELERYFLSCPTRCKGLQLTLFSSRLALSHNLISTFPSRFAECTSLRYLNVRNNIIREFPQSVSRIMLEDPKCVED